MKIYTHYNLIGNTERGYRWRTLLQFGTSWNIIGSIVMMNPGNANFKHSDHRPEADVELLNHLRQFDNSINQNEAWYEFNSDPTLDIVNEMFSERSRVNGFGELNGVIQVFNLFYLRDPNLDKGIELNNKLELDSTNDTIFEDDIKNLKAPLYLGFGQLSQNPQFKDKAKFFFDKAIGELGVKYLDPVFEKNSFMHPRRLMRYMKYKPEGILLKLQFYYNVLSSPKIQESIGDISKLYLIKNKLIEKTNTRQWWIHKGWDLGITFNDKTNRIGIESWFGREGVENDNYYHAFITVWNPQCFSPYEQVLKRIYPNSLITHMGNKNRIYLNLPIIKSTDIDIIAESLTNYYNVLLEITNKIK